MAAAKQSSHFSTATDSFPFIQCVQKILLEVVEKIKMYYAEGWKAIAIDDTEVGAGVSDILKPHGVDFFPVSLG